MNKITAGIIVIVLLVIAGGIWLTKGNQNTDQARETWPLKVGMIAILSGEYAAAGENIKNGALLAAEQYNAANPDRKVELITEDDGYDSKKALSAYQKLTGVDDIDALINTSTPSIGAIYEIVTKTDMPVIQGGEQPVEPTDDNVFQLMPGNIEAERQLGAYLKQKGSKNPALVYTNHDTFIRFKNGVLEGFGGPMKEFAVGADEKDFAPHVLKVVEMNPDVVVMITQPQSGAQFLKEYANIKTTLPPLAFDANLQSGVTDYERILGGMSTLNGATVVTLPAHTSQEFKDAYKTRFGIEPGFFSDVGYDAFNLLMKSYDTDGTRWIKNVKNVNFAGVSGKIEFDKVGVRKPIVKIVIIENGQIPTGD